MRRRNSNPDAIFELVAMLAIIFAVAVAWGYFAGRAEANGGYADGYYSGYPDGYCYQKTQCIAPPAPPAPIPEPGYDTYSDGYQDGFLEGRYDGKL